MTSALTDQRLRDYPFALESELDDAAREHGYRLFGGAAAGWRFWTSATARGEIGIGAASLAGPFFLSVEHPGTVRELEAEFAAPPARGHSGAFVFDSRDALCAGVSRAYQLGVALPTLPLEQFEAEVAQLGDTEADAIVRRRVGQDRFRAALLEYHGGRCQITGISDPELLRASHIIPWAKCESDAERLDVHNGLLLSSLWDAAFDSGLVSFEDDGAVLVSPRTGHAARAVLSADPQSLRGLTDAHRERLHWHRQHLFVR